MTESEAREIIDENGLDDDALTIEDVNDALEDGNDTLASLIGFLCQECWENLKAKEELKKAD